MAHWLLSTDGLAVPLVLRLTLAVVMFPHGAQKLLGWFGGHGFFMNWYGTQPGEGYEYHLLALGIALALVIGGGGAWSVDALIAR